MGGRGAFSSGALQSGSFREYYQIDTAGDIKVIAKYNEKESKSLPLRSSTPERIYGILNKDGSPKQIGIYKNNHLVTTIDFPSAHKTYVHANDWAPAGKDKKGEITVRIGERNNLSNYEKKLVRDFLKSRRKEVK